jgi:hypothetical protein
MVQVCERCHRTNPREAIYCHHDGGALGARVGADQPAESAGNAATKPFTAPLVFASGSSCRNLQQLAEACRQKPAIVWQLLQQGNLENFLAGQGRIDLAAAARAAARAADRQRGLDDFLGRLPVRLPPARLRVEPAALDFGTTPVGEGRRVELVLHNDGQRLLYGSAVADADWLSLGDDVVQRSKLFQGSERVVIPVRILGRHLRALDRPQETTIRLESSGGSFTVPVRVRVPVRPFGEGVLAGARSPRQLARLAHDAPKEAAVLIENGAVAHWYQANGWPYPVRGPTASGVAAVQQLFEALGLVKPPAVELSEDAVRLEGRPGELLEYSLAVVTQENRAAIAHGRSDQPWLQVGQPIFRGRSAFLPLTVAAVPGQSGDTLHACVSVTANGGQRFTVPVTLAVAGTSPAPPRPPRPEVGRPAAAPIPVAAVAPAPVPVAVAPRRATAWIKGKGKSKGGGERGWLGICLPALLLVAVTVGGVLRDALAPEQPPALNNPGRPVDATPRLEIRFHEAPRDDLLDTLYLPEHQPTMRFGLVTLRRGKEIGTGIQVRRLTFDPWGRTNNTCLRFDGADERLFGSGGNGHWEESAVRGWKDDQDQEHDGVKSVWVWDDRQVAVGQYVELVRGKQSGLLDTCRVRYRIDNRDAREHTIGLRFLLDTFIGGNDGVPFTIPGEPDLCDTSKDLPGQASNGHIPRFLQALENADLARPGTIAHLELKLEKLEPPARVTLGAWPNEKLRVLNRKASGPLTLWDVPLLSLKSLGLNDSAVTMYWSDKPLEPGGKREVGFEYGLWALASAGSRLATVVDGAFRPEGELTVVAYVNRTGAANGDDTVTLKLPPDFQFLEGEATQRVPRLPANAASANVPITWRVQAGPTGSYEFTVTSSFGASQVLPVEIRQSIY